MTNMLRVSVELHVSKQINFVLEKVNVSVLVVCACSRFTLQRRKIFFELPLLLVRLILRLHVDRATESDDKTP